MTEKESYRWQQASERMAERLGEIQKQVITVCDREADIWHYLHYKVSRGKPHAECDAKRRAGSPPGPDAHQLQRSQHKKSRQQRPGALAHVCLLRGAGEDGACWYPLTSEKVASAADARRIVSHYEQRWLIEEYHKAWKSGGTCVESLRMQTRDNLERRVVIAVRVLGLRQGSISEETQNDSCEKILTPTEWKLLWVKLEGKQLPAQTPTLKWACLKLAKLGRWHDSKRTSSPGWVVMWDGWFRHQDMAEGYLVMKSLDQEI
ncbi:IS4 family transposase [Escherichia coli]